MQIAVAQPGKGGAQHHLARLRASSSATSSIVSGWFGGVQDGGFHPNLPLFGRRMLTLRGGRVTPRSEPSSTGRALGAPAEPG